MMPVTCRVPLVMTLFRDVSNIIEMQEKVVTTIITQSRYVTKLTSLLKAHFTSASVILAKHIARVYPGVWNKVEHIFQKFPTRCPVLRAVLFCYPVLLLETKIWKKPKICQIRTKVSIYQLTRFKGEKGSQAPINRRPHKTTNIFISCRHMLDF